MLSQAIPTKERVDPRVKRTRQLLERALYDLLQEKDLQTITIGDIAEQATVNRATFYAHFETKYALFDYVIHHSFQRVLWNKLPASPEYSLDNLRRLILAVCEYFAQLTGDCSPSEVHYRPLIEAQVQAQLYELLLSWIDPLQIGDAAGPIKPQVAAAFTSWAIFGVGLQWSREGMCPSAEEAADQVLALIGQGCMLWKARKEGAMNPSTENRTSLV